MTNDRIILCDTIIIHRGNACNADCATEGAVRAGAVHRRRVFSTFEKIIKLFLFPITTAVMQWDMTGTSY